jgi:hypothetical protein
MNRRDKREDRSHGEGYPDAPAPESADEEDRYGVRRERPQPGRQRRAEPKPASPPPSHERNS